MSRCLTMVCVLLVFPAAGYSQTAGLHPVRIAGVSGGHIHPAFCVSRRGTLVVIYGRVNHRELAVTRSTDGGKTWTLPTPFVHTLKTAHYPGSLTALENGQILHAWNRWSGETKPREPRWTLFSLSSDEGVTWSAPQQPLPRDPQSQSIIRHPIVELSPRQWLFSLSDKTFLYDPTSESNKPFGNGRVHGLVPIVRTPKGTFVSAAGLRSVDDGKTWQEMDKFPDYGVNLGDRSKNWSVPGSGYRNELVCLSNGVLLASEIVGRGRGGVKLRYVISRDDGVTWDDCFEYYNPGRPIGGRACPRTVQLNATTIGVVFFDVSPKQAGGPGLFFLRIPLAKLESC